MPQPSILQAAQAAPASVARCDRPQRSGCPQNLLMLVAVLASYVAVPMPTLQADQGEAALQEYLTKTFDDKIDRVEVASDRVIITGHIKGLGENLFLAEIPMERQHDDSQRFESLIPVQVTPNGHFTVSRARHRDRQGQRHDRLTARWQLVKITDSHHVARSHARYADDVHCRTPELPAIRPKNKKGLGAWRPSLIPSDIEQLGIGSVTVNVVLHTLASLTPEPNTFPVTWQGCTFHVRRPAINRLDETFRRASSLGLMVSAIILVANPARSDTPVVRLLGHPDATPAGHYAMPNVTDREGLAFYGGLLNFMAERWSYADNRYGRIHHWIMHNEVDAGYEWTNCGLKPAVVYMDMLQRSLRLMHLIARQYDPHARTFISLTHHWANPGNAKWYGSKQMLDLLTDFCRIEGDFPWAVAFHAYPQNLGDPRTWDDQQAVFRFDTPKITPRNLEVLDAYLRQQRFLYAGTPRPIHFSENGFHSKNYGEAALADQAAGMAYAWMKLKNVSLAEVWHYHNWIDNRHEGGLRLGLRKFPDDPADPLGPKPIWHLYRALGTAGEGATADMYLGRIGAASWAELLPAPAIE